MYILHTKCDLNKAYQYVCEQELQKIFPRSIGVNWKKELQDGLNELDKDFYEQIIYSCAQHRYDTKIAAGVITAKMLGVGSTKSISLLKRIVNHKYTDNELLAIITSITTIPNDVKAQNNLRTLDVKQYQVLGEPDCKTYAICAKMNGRIFNIDELKAGITAPPFHKQCTCAIVPYIPD